MPWVRVHDGALRNLKVQALSDNAFRLWVAGLQHCQEHLTDGEIRFQHLPLLPIRKVKQASIDELCASVLGKAPLWEQTPDGYRVHDYLTWNDTREQVLEKREQARVRKEKWNATRNAFRDASRNALPHHTTPQRTKDPKHVPAGAETPPEFLDFWNIYPRKDAKADALKAWRQVQPKNGTVEAILANVRERCQSDEWTKERGRFIPLPATFLRGRRWEDGGVDSSGLAASQSPVSPKALELAREHYRKAWGARCQHEEPHEDWQECVLAIARHQQGLS